ncbi:MAG: CbrC family protein [Pirellulales bacterium]
MGSTFRYIHDSALVESDLGVCQHCARQGFAAYDYHGEIVDSHAAANVALALVEKEIYAACAPCIHDGNIRKRDYELERIRPIVDEFARDKTVAIRDYHRIPHIPLMMQDADWPMCCGDWCEFLGNPPDFETSLSVPFHFRFWDHSPAEYLATQSLVPESLREVCLFRCLACTNSYFIWQPT